MCPASTVKREQKKTASGEKSRHGLARKSKFKVKARPDSIVYIAGTFNEWDPTADRMAHAGDGWHIASLALSVGRHEYKFLVDGVWCLDPECPDCVPNAFGSHNHVIEIY